MIIGRELSRDEIEQIWAIDRREEIENIYYYENGRLVLRPEVYHMKGWPPGEAEKYTPHLVACFDRGGWFYGLFDLTRLVAVVILENEPIGKNSDLLQLKFLHVSCGYRKQGLGTQLFDLAKDMAKQRGAKGLYISATPSENTIHFYLQQGSRVTSDPDPALFALEPEDIHLVCLI